MKFLSFILLTIILSTGLVSAIDYTSLLKGSGKVNLNKNRIELLQDRFGIDLGQITNTTINGRIAITIDNAIQIQNLLLVGFTYNNQYYTAIIPLYKIQ